MYQNWLEPSGSIYHLYKCNQLLWLCVNLDSECMFQKKSTAGLYQNDFGCCSWPVKCKHLNFNCIIKKKVPTYIFESPWSLLLLQVFANFLQERSCRNCLEIHNFIWHCKKYQKTVFWTLPLWSESPMIIQNSQGSLYLKEVSIQGWVTNSTTNFEFYYTYLMKKQ